MSKWGANRNCQTTSCSSPVGNLKKMNYILLLVLLLDHRQTDRQREREMGGGTKGQAYR
jgi:hypothetical protein